MASVIRSSSRCGRIDFSKISHPRMWEGLSWTIRRGRVPSASEGGVAQEITAQTINNSLGPTKQNLKKQLETMY